MNGRISKGISRGRGGGREGERPGGGLTWLPIFTHSDPYSACECVWGERERERERYLTIISQAHGGTWFLDLNRANQDNKERERERVRDEWCSRMMMLIGEKGSHCWPTTQSFPLTLPPSLSLFTQWIGTDLQLVANLSFSLFLPICLLASFLSFGAFELVCNSFAFDSTWSRSHT